MRSTSAPTSDPTSSDFVDNVDMSPAVAECILLLLHCKTSADFSRQSIKATVLHGHEAWAAAAKEFVRDQNKAVVDACIVTTRTVH